MMPVAPVEPMYPTIPHIAWSPHRGKYPRNGATRVPACRRGAFRSPAPAWTLSPPHLLPLRNPGTSRRVSALVGVAGRFGLVGGPRAWAPLLGPALLDDLGRPLQCEGARGDVTRNHGCGADVAIVPVREGGERT